MLFKVCRGACIVLALSAGATATADETVEHVLGPSADSYNYSANQPHGGLNFFPVFTDADAGLTSVGMIEFDVTGLDVDPADIIAVRLELTVAAAQNGYGMGGPDGMVQLFEREFGFDEADPNPPIAKIGDPLVESYRQVNDLSLLVLESEALADLVRMWVADPLNNNGLDMTFVAADPSVETFWLALRTKEWSNPAHHPRLVVTELIPAPSAGLVLLAGALGSMKRRR